MIKLGGFTLLSPVGRGGMGEVWLSEHDESGQRVAIKVLSSARAKDDRYQRSFRREARAIASLDHPNIVAVHDYGLIDDAAAKAARGRLTPGTPYMVMEYVGGGTLNSWRQKLDWGQLRAVLLSLLDALAHAHARQVIHRDLKPGNVLVGGQAESVKLTDFGLAHAVDREGLTMTSPAGGMGGTPAYMAPEQFVGDPRDVGAWSDLYALGCMIYSLLTGAPPFGRKPWLEVANGHLHRKPPRLDLTINAPRGFDEWVARLLEKDSANRYQRASDAAWDLCELDDPTEVMPRRKKGQLEDEEEEGPFAKAHKTQTTLLWGDQFARQRIPKPEETPTQLEVLMPSGKRVPPMTLNWRGPERRYRPPLGTGLFEVLALPMVGRESEREAVWAALRRVREQGHTECVVLQGSAGRGTSRLAEWMVTRVEELGAATGLRAEHSPISTEQDGLGPMVARWARAIGLERESTRQRIENQLDLIGQADAPLAKSLSEVLKPNPGDGRSSGIMTLRISHVAQRYETLRQLFQKIAADRPIVASLDDVQWGLEALEFVDWLLRSETPLPMLVVMTVQPEQMPPESAEAAVLAEILAQSRSTLIELGPLDARDRQTLLRDVLELSPELAARVDARTDGNPQFAVQLVTDWIRRDAVERTDNGYKLRKGAELVIPDDLHAAWSQAVQSLLDTRPESDGIALELAAVLGRQVRTAAWIDVCQRSGVVPSEGLVDVLVARQLARMRDADEEGWAFASGMVHESILRRVREAGRWQAHHAQCANMLSDASTPADAERLARHLAEAGEDSQALVPMRLAIDGAIATGDYRVTQALLGEMESMLERLGADEDDPRRAWSHVFRARMRRLGRRVSEATQEGEAAEKAARRGTDREALLEALLERARIETRGGSPDRAIQRLEEAAQIARALGDPLKVAEVEAEIGTAHGRLGDPTRAKDLFMQAIRTYRAQDRTDLAAEVWMGLAEIGRTTGRHDLARKWAGEARRCFEEQGNRWGVAAALNTEADLLRMSGDLSGAEKMFRDVLARYEELGVASGAVARLNLALVLLARESWDEARAEFQRFRSSAGATYPLARAVSHAGLAACAANSRMWPEMQRQMLQVRTTTERGVVHDVDLANLLQLAGSMAAAAGKQRHARLALEAALDQWRSLGRRAQAKKIAEALQALE